MSEAPKYTVAEVLASIEWSVEKNKLMLLSKLTDEYVTLDIEAITKQK